MWTELGEYAILVKIGKRIKEERIKLDMQQKEVAVFCGVSLSTVVRVEQGIPVSMEKFIRILRALNLLENLELLVPEQPLSPILMRKLKGKRRYRIKKKLSDYE